MAQGFERDRITWLAYLMLALYGYFLNAFGPITPFLKNELDLTYTISSLHTTAFAIGILLVGLGGHLVVARIGRWKALWVGAFGLSTSAALLLLGKSPLVTIAASFLMGLLGSFILVLVPSTLSDRHGERRAVALSEANLIASLVSAFAPLMISWAAGELGNWRWGVAVFAGLTPILFVGFARRQPEGADSARPVLQAARGRLPVIFWVYWAAVTLVVSVEFCMIFWSADYLETVTGLNKVSAAASVSLFLAAMIAGRWVSSRLVERFPLRGLVSSAILLAGAGFLLFWLPKNPLLAQIGLSVCGLGVASLYPLNLSLAMGAAGGQAVLAGARTTLASGSAILLLPLALGRLADAFGIRPAYGLVLALLAGAFALIQITGRRIK